jgi:hypothetical protein
MRYKAGGQGAQKAGRDVTKTGAASNQAGNGKWHPTIVTLLGLIGGEIAVLAVMRKLTRHGG